MQGNKINFDNFISNIHREFGKVRQDTLVATNIAKLDYLEGFVIGMIKLVRSCYDADLNRFGRKQ